ncbi:MAG: HAMP domain-containing histidine kinase [Rhodothermaceae bacterium]|nr:HAMP domain-containing histidine kinase [Rhodothermaceae bacterium]
MKKSRAFSVILLLAVILTSTLCFSAYFQYNWLNQLSEAEEVRIRTSVENTAHLLGDELNQEMMSALFTFVIPAPESRKELTDKLSERWIEWYATSAHPGLVKHIYWMEYNDSGEEKLYQYNEVDTVLERVKKWVPANGMYPEIETFFGEDVVSPMPYTRQRPTSISGLNEFPLIPFGSGLRETEDRLFIVFDMAYISNEWMPELVYRFFQNYEQGDYDILITNREAADHVVYASGPNLEMHEDADVSLNVGPPDPLYVMRLFSRMIARPPDRSRRGEGARRGERGPPPGLMPLRIWTLNITHKSGALETAVAKMHRRNLGISFLVLMVLGISIGLILLYTRRKQRLADQQVAFVAGVSHDLKTPIAVIHAVGENLRDGLVNEPEEMHEYGTFVVDQSRSLLSTLDQVLSFAGITLGGKQYTEQSVDLNKVVQRTLSRIELDLKDVELDLDLDASLPGIKGDEEALTSVVQNLVQNAIKYSDEYPQVSLATFVDQGALHLTVKDTGRGIDVDDQPYVFDPFYRSAQVRASQIRGNGLGLSIVKNIVEAHKGTITFRSAPNLGTTFHLTFPSF